MLFLDRIAHGLGNDLVFSIVCLRLDTYQHIPLRTEGLDRDLAIVERVHHRTDLAQVRLFLGLDLNQRTTPEIDAEIQSRG